MNAEALALENSKSRFADYSALSKPGITAMVVMTAGLGFFAAGGGPAMLLTAMLLGTALAAAGANTLNMVMERKYDALMDRTKNRPLPAGRLSPTEALLFGTVLCVAGMLVLTFFANPIAGALAAVTIATYLFAYTPLKRKTSLSTVVGAVPGAIPPMIGWAAVTGGLETGAWMFFVVMFFWQLPHFLAIAWMYRDDYGRAGYPVLTVGDSEGVATSRQIIMQTTGLLMVSAVPFLVKMAGPVYLAAALALGIGMLALGVRFAMKPERGRARQLFFSTIIYLPIVLALMTYGG